MIHRTYEVSFVTPAFLGGADQSGQWRTPPFKALLRQWWRVAYAAGGCPDPNALRESEGRFFGRASETGASTSRIRLRLSDWRGGRGSDKDWQAYRFGVVQHPEVKHRAGVALYLGYGPVDAGTKDVPTRLKREHYLLPDAARELRIRYPEPEEPRLSTAVRLIQCFGALGGRARNGFGSLSMVSTDADGALDLEALLDPEKRSARDWLRELSRDWREALNADWCHSVGQDSDGLLVWRTELRERWEDVLGDLAEVKIAYRTQFHFKGAGPHAAMCDRHVLAYPITKHELKGWERSANQILLKVLRVAENCFSGIVLHAPHGLPNLLKQVLSEGDKDGLRAREERVWSAVHHALDQHRHLTRLV